MWPEGEVGKEQVEGEEEEERVSRHPNTPHYKSATPNVTLGGSHRKKTGYKW